MLGRKIFDAAAALWARDCGWRASVRSPLPDQKVAMKHLVTRARARLPLQHPSECFISELNRRGNQAVVKNENGRPAKETDMRTGQSGKYRTDCPFLLAR